MASNFSGFNFNSPGVNSSYQTPPMFLQPQGNVYLINDTLEVANVPMGSGVSAAICPSKSILYLKMYQNGAPAMTAYTLSPYEPTPQNTISQDKEFNEWKEKLNNLEQKINLLISKQGGNLNELL